MITNYLLDNSTLVPVVFALIAVVCVGVGYLVRHRPRVLWGLTALSALPVLALTLVPTTSRVDRVVCVVQFSLPTLGSVELLANVALFFPPVFFATLATRRPVLVLAAAAGVSAVIEAVQAVLPVIGRACDTNDWAMNTAGAVLAVLLATATATATVTVTVRRSRSGSPRAAPPADSPPGADGAAHREP